MQAAAEQQTPQQLIQHLLADNERLKAALQRSSTANGHGSVYTAGNAAASSMDAAPCNSELLLSKRSPSCTALQTPLSPQQQQQELGSLLARLQQGSVAGDEEQQLEDMCPSSPDQVRRTSCDVSVSLLVRLLCTWTEGSVRVHAAAQDTRMYLPVTCAGIRQLSGHLMPHIHICISTNSCGDSSSSKHPLNSRIHMC